MKKLEMVLGILLIIPIGLIIASITDPKLLIHHSDLEWLFILVGIPIVVLNYWAWKSQIS